MRLLRTLLALGLLSLLAIGALLWWARQPLDLVPSHIEFTIAPGSSLRAIGRTVRAAGVPVDALLFSILARVEGRSSHLEAGTYAVDSGVTPRAVLEKIERGDVLQLEFVIPEGWSFRQLRAALGADKDVRPTLTNVSDREVLVAIGAGETDPEGLFFPDTYRITRGTPDVDVLRRAYRSQQKRLAEAWAARVPDLPYANPREALILASIVEKETGRPEDRPLVAAVLVNRLRRGMPLQTDPSVIFGLGPRYDGALHKRDLLADTPYNTYTRAGLPPGPIGLPGTAALAAALNPAKSEALYFVARGDGTSEFSENLDDHNRAVARFQKGGRP
jgi:UPF0755 protein